VGVTGTILAQQGNRENKKQKSKRKETAEKYDGTESGYHHGR